MDLARTPACPQRPPLLRPVDGRLLAGVAAGVGAHLGVPVRGVRLALVLGSALFGAGALAYLLLRAAVPEGPGRPARGPADHGAAPREPRRRFVADDETGVWLVPGVVLTTLGAVLLDVHLPGGEGGGGAEVLRRCGRLVTTAGEPVRFLALSVSDPAADVISVIRAGARGYVTKTIDGAELSDAVRRVAGGDEVFSPRLAGFVLDAFGTGSADLAAVDDELDRLTAREREVMRLIDRGYACREVGKELFISVKTVETHVSSVLRKLQLSSRHELTRWAADRRLL